MFGNFALFLLIALFGIIGHRGVISYQGTLCGCLGTHNVKSGTHKGLWAPTIKCRYLILNIVRSDSAQGPVYN